MIDRRLLAVTLTPDLLAQPDLGPEDRLLIATLASFGNVPTPPREVLAVYLGCSIRAVSRIVSRLKKSGWIGVDERRGEHGVRLSNHYRLGRNGPWAPVVDPQGAKVASCATGRNIKGPGQIVPTLNSDLGLGEDKTSSPNPKKDSEKMVARTRATEHAASLEAGFGGRP